MNAKNLVAAVTVLLASGAALAQEYVDPAANFTSTKSRAEVVADLQQARADGSLDVLEGTYPDLPKSASMKTRAEVFAEVQQARADGSLYVADGSYPSLPAIASLKTRQEVRAGISQNPNGLSGNVNSVYFGG